MPTAHPLLVITDPAIRAADGELARVALDVLRGAAPVKTASPRTPAELHAALDRRGKRRPVVVGGDQVLHAVVQTLHRRRELAGSPLGWVPIHARTPLARQLDLPVDPAGAARVVLTGEERWLDLLVDDADGIAISEVRIGVRAALPTRPSLPLPVDRAARWLSDLRGGPRRGGWRLRIEADGAVLVDLDRPVRLVGLANLTALDVDDLAAGSAPDDGLAEIVVSETSRTRPWRAQAARRDGDGQPRDGVHLTRARAVTVSGQDFPYDEDGVAGGPVRLRTWTVRHAAWRMTVPTAPTRG